MAFLPNIVKGNFYQTCQVLIDQGIEIAPSDIPGLILVNGNEMTMGQVVILGMTWPSSTPTESS